MIRTTLFLHELGHYGPTGMIVKDSNQSKEEPRRMCSLVYDYIAPFWDKSALHGESHYAEWYGMQSSMAELRGTVPPDALRDSAFLLSEITL